MNLRLNNVIRDITGVTGLAIIDAILAIERDPKVLAKHRDRRIKVDEQTIAKSLVGDYKTEHLFTLKRALELYRYHQSLIEACDKEIETHLQQFETCTDEEPGDNSSSKSGGNAPGFDVQSYLYKIFGVDLMQIPGIGAGVAHTIFAQISNDIHKFKTMRQFTA